MVNYPKDWKILPIKDIAKYRRGSFPQPYDKPEWYDGPDAMPFVQVADIDENMKLCEKTNSKISKIAMPKSIFVKKGTLICSIQGSIGRTAITQYDSYIDRTIAIFKKFKININQKYFMYQLKRKFDVEKENAKGSTIKTITVAEYGEFLIAFPTPKEQDTIVDTLSSFDKHIDNLTKLIEKKKSIRNGAVEDLVTGKNRLAGFDDEWESVSFNDVIFPKARIGWQGLKKKEYLQSGYSYLIGGTDFNNGTISTASIWSVSKERYQMDNNIQVSTYDVLVTKDGTIGKVALVPKLNKPATLNSGVFVFKTNSKLNSKFLYRVLTSSIFKDFITTLSAGSTIKHLYQKDLKKLEFRIPIDIKEQQAIAEILTTMDNEIISLEKELNKMKQIREGAMDDLLMGRVRIKV